MPNGGDPEKCAKVARFYRSLEGILKAFAEQHGLSFTPWYHDAPTFIFEEPKDRGPGFTGIVRNIHLYLESQDEGEAVVNIFAMSFSDRDWRKTKDVWVAKGKIPRDEARIYPWLGVAHAFCVAIDEADLKKVEAWQEENQRLAPLFE